MKSPFDILELKPFLYASPEDQAHLKSHHLKLSRQFHPDRFANASADEQKKNEERSSEINRAAREILDPWARLESFFRLQGLSINTGKEAKVPDLAMEYFQVQEDMDENPEKRESLRDAFLKKLSLELENARAKLEEISKPYAYKNPSSPWPPPPDLTQRLLELYQRRNYIKRMTENLAPGPKGLL